jgi:hypothetical protein
MPSIYQRRLGRDVSGLKFSKAFPKDFQTTDLGRWRWHFAVKSAIVLITAGLLENHLHGRARVG